VLQLHADLHKWDATSFVDALPEFDLPRQSEFARKEALYLRILDLLDRGKAWEIAIEISKELQQQYEQSVFDYKRNSELLSHQATLYDSIASDPRAYAPFFRVGYYGRGFPVRFSLSVFLIEATIANCRKPFTRRRSRTNSL
jgi:dedicator of cytokinesis protein 3